MELFKLLGTIAISGSDKAKKDIDNVSDKASKFGETLSNVGGKISDFGGKLTTRISAPLTALGALSVKAAADVKAANSQFEQTFGELQEKATDAISRVSEDAGILETRLKGVGTSIYAFAKSSGADSAEAMELMETALQATADAAAYYDRSLEDTAESLQSFLKGNYENDAALGVSATETTRNAAAMELFGVKFNDLTEIQKQQTLLKMVTDSQELSGAMGQASRESDGFENVMGNLTESTKLLSAELGEVLLPKVIEIIQKATDFINKFKEMDEGTKNLIITIGGIAAVAGPVLVVIGQMATGVSSFISVATKIPGIVSKGATALVNMKEGFVLAKGGMTALGAQASPFGAALAGISAPVVASIAAIVAAIGILSAALFTLWNNNEEFRNNMTAIQEDIKGKFEAFTSGIVERLNSLGFDFENITEVIKAIWQGFCDFLAPVFEFAYQSVSITLGGALDIILGIVDFFIALFTGNWQGMCDAVLSILESAWEMLKNKFNLVKDFIAEVLNAIWSKMVEIWENIKLSISEKIESIKNTVETKFNAIKDKITEKINNAKDAVKEAIDKIKGFFDFEFKWPDLKMPHFKISPSGWKIGDLLEGEIPSLGIEWYAKGGVLEEPTAFGINGNKLMVGGEAGPEAVAPIDVLQKYIAEAVATQNADLVNVLQKILAAITSNNKQMKDKFIEALEEMRFDINNREFARLVKAVR